MEYFDISPLINENLAVFPGDQKFVRKLSLDFAKGDNIELSALTTTVHLGAHADAPSHYHKKGQSIDQRALHHYLGPCQVIHVQLPKAERVLPKHLGQTTIKAQRVLIATGSYDHYHWSSEFNSLSPELIEFLARQKVFLVGIDTPSIDPADSKALETHQAIFRHDFAVLEGLDLSQVPDGLYTLCALPLKIAGGEASPVRAILLKTEI